MAPSVETQVKKLSLFLSNYLETGPAPILWVGAGASAAAGYPTLGQLEEILRKKLPDVDADGYHLMDAYVDEYSKADLARLLQQHLGAPRPFAPIHEAIARLAGAGVFPLVFTTNYDRLLEDALSEARLSFVPQSLENNYILQEMDQVQLLKMHGDLGDWLNVVLTTYSYREFEKTYPLLTNQLNQSLRTHPVVFVGCSMTDPRLLDWLKRLTPAERSKLFASRAILTEKAWARLPKETQELLASANVKPVLVEDNAAVTQLLRDLAVKLAPLQAEELIFDLEPGEDEWTVTGPTLESPAHKTPNPLKDAELIARMVKLKESVSRAVTLDHPEAPQVIAELQGLGLSIGARLTSVLLSDTARQEVLRRMSQVDHGRARLVLRVRDEGPRGDQALALPWELITPESGAFAVREGKLDIVREAVRDGAPHLEKPTGPLTVAVTIAAPEDQSQLSYERESFRLQGALTALGQRAAFSDLGGVDDCVEVVAGQQAAAVHFSGHGLPGKLVFEDDYGFSDSVPIEELLRRLRLELPEPDTFPRLFFLASCHGATGGRAPAQPAETASSSGSTRQPRGDMAAALGEGPSAAATLHRNGFVQVIGYFGPVGDELCTRAEEEFYGALAKGETTLQAAARARASLIKPLEVDGQEIEYPLGWAQLAVYHRGPDLPLAVPANVDKGKAKDVFRRRTVEVSGLPILEHGFIGRRGIQHEIRRRVEKEGRRLIVLQGLGGLGKTALASQLLSRTFASDNRDRLILRGRGLEEEADPIAKLRAQAEEHGKVHALPRWEERLKQLREEIPDPVRGFAATIESIRENRPNLVLYVDNAESLQDGPKTEANAVGNWKLEALEWWAEMECLAEDGLVLVSTRYGWNGLDPEAWIIVDPMSPADVLRMLDTFPSLKPLNRKDRERLASRVDGHPRTLEILDSLIHERRMEQGPGFEVRDPWADLIEPVLPDHAEKISADLLLEELWERLTPAAREHAIRLGVLRVPAPRFVIDKLGSATGELIRTSVLTRFREQVLSEEGLEWLDRWGLHSLVRAFVESKTDDDRRRNAHLAAGEAFEEWVKGEGVLWSEQVEGIHHFHTVGEGDRAWPMVREYVHWLRHRARYRDALVLLESCEAAGTKGEPLANALMLMAQMRRQLGERSFELATILDRSLGLAFSDELKSDVLGEYGSLRRDQGEYGKSEVLLRQSLDLKEKSLGVSHPHYGVLLHQLAVVLSRQGKYVEAEGLLRRSLAVDEKSLGVSHPSYGASLHALAGVLSSQGKYVEAERLLRQSLEVNEKSLGVSHPSYGASLHELARVLSRQGEYVEAERLLRQSLDVDEKSLGVSHPSYGTSLHELARVLSHQGKYVEAERLLRQSLELKEKSLGVSHPEYGASLHELARVLSHQGKYVEAEGLLRQSLEVKEKSLGVSHPEYGASLHELAGALVRQGKYVEAEGLLRQSLELKEKSLGVSHPSVYSTLTNLAGVLADQGRAEEGEPFLQKALEIALQVHGSLHPDVAQILNLLAQLQTVLGRPEAEETARQALAALEATLGGNHPTTREVTPILQRIAAGAGAADPVSQLVSQARTAAQQHDFLAAISAQEQVVELARAAGEEGEVLVVLSVLLFNLAGYYSNANRHEDAVKAFEEVVALDERTGHPDLESDRQALEEARRMAELSPEQRERLEAMKSLFRQIATVADQARDGVIAAIRGEMEREGLIVLLEESAGKAAEGEADGSPWSDLAVYLRAVVAFLRGEPVPPVPAAFAERMEEIEAAARS